MQTWHSRDSVKDNNNIIFYDLLVWAQTYKKYIDPENYVKLYSRYLRVNLITILPAEKNHSYGTKTDIIANIMKILQIYG